MKHDELLATHAAYDSNVADWEFHLKSYLGGSQYQTGEYLLKYIEEDKDEFAKRIAMTPVDNHCKTVVKIYTSFTWRLPPTRNMGSLDGDKVVEAFMQDADLDGRKLDAFMNDGQTWANVYGHCWIMVDKPQSNARTRAEELQQELRPYLNLITPENVLDWNYERAPSGRYVLTYIKIREMVQGDITHVRVWTPEDITLYRTNGKEVTVLDQVENALGVIPAVCLYGQRSPIRGVGVSPIGDIATMQKAIYNELSEMEQLIRISNHPSLVKEEQTDASAGAGSVITAVDGDKPYLLQPNGGNLSAIMESINEKTESINRMAHMGAVRGSEATTMSGVALQTEFQLLNACLSEQADLLELAEEQIWDFYCMWQDTINDVEVDYPDTFDLRDYGTELEFLQKARTTTIKSATFAKGVDKAIAELVLQDEELNAAIAEIDGATYSTGTFASNFGE